ncbi:MAG: hypothetical protein HPY76_10300 [Anaerolineae bacterium]|nr:hypothetical protein [Anaerolineae bacterium]
MNDVNRPSVDLKAAAILLAINVAIAMFISSLVKAPGYMDAEYYYAGGVQLFNGNGFTEPYVWNYLDGIDTLPRPSHTYWMPLVSILSTGGMWLTGGASFFSARLLFVLLFIFTPVVVVLIATGLGVERKFAILAGYLALFPGYYLPYFVTTDGFIVYVLLGGMYFFTVHRIFRTSQSHARQWFCLGVISGLMHLTRADGLMWFITAGLLWLIANFNKKQKHEEKQPISHPPMYLLLMIVGYLLPMGLWYWRNLSLYSSLMSPVGARVLWLTDYDQLFTFPPSNLTPQFWLSSGMDNILKDRLSALGNNIGTFVAVQNNIYLLPLTVIGFIKLRKRVEFRTAIFLWLLTLTVMTVVYPYAGMRGGFFHSGAGFQVMFWISSAVGLDAFVQFMTDKRRWDGAQAWRFFSALLVVVGLIFTTYISYSLVFDPSSHENQWSAGWQKHHALSEKLMAMDISEDSIVMINDPPGFYLATNQPAIVIPDGDIHTTLEVADIYEAELLIIEENHVNGLDDLYENPRDLPGLDYIGNLTDAKIFRFISTNDG